MTLATLRSAVAERWPFAQLFEVNGVQYEPFPRSIVPSDMDGVVHMRDGNRFLFLEGKREGEREMSRAQRETLEGLVRAGHDVLVFWARGTEIIALEHVSHDPSRRMAGGEKSLFALNAFGRFSLTASINLGARDFPGQTISRAEG